MPEDSDGRPRLQLPAFKMLLALAIGSAVFWTWPSKSIKLNPDGYAIATALYRVCNQQDVDGLRQIDVHVRQATDSGALPNNQQMAILQIMRDARSGNWEVAMKQCRSLLENQVTYHSAPTILPFVFSSPRIQSFVNAASGS